MKFVGVVRIMNKKLLTLVMSACVMVSGAVSAQMREGSGDIATATDDMLGHEITVGGVVDNIYVSKNGHLFVLLKDRHTDNEDRVKVVVFASSPMVHEAEVTFREAKAGDEIVNVSGEYREYNGEREIVAKKIYL